MSLLIIPYPVFRKYVVEHREITFIYGNDFYEKGCLGQAWELANEPNTFRIPTCNKMCPSSSDKFFYDQAFASRWKKMIDDAIEAIPKNNPIIVLPKIGCGCSRMRELAPVSYKYMWDELNKIKFTNFIWKYVC